jgi:GNAT superfamily N-acetyltransferase
VLAHLDALAALRITVFRDWPYLYGGDMGYERRYVATYAASAHAAVIGAFDGDVLVGAATCLPLADETANVIAPFAARGLDIDRFFYFGESVLDKAYRGRGAGVAFFAAREAHARAVGCAAIATFCAVQRPDDHRLKPADAVPLDAFWSHRGYQRRPDFTCRMQWRDIDRDRETEKTLVFWMKSLSGEALPACV